MALLESIIASAALPAVVDAVKGIGGAIGRKWFGLSVDDEVKIMTAQMEQLKALAALDSPGGTPSQWVVDLRASFRYIGAGLCIVIGTMVLVIGLSESSSEAIEMGASLVSMPFGFIFGERMVLRFNGKK